MIRVTRHRALLIELVCVGLLTLAAMYYFFNRGFNYYDEGHVLHLAERILNGDIPYKDFHFIYTPGTLYITAAALRLLGVSILSGRILLLLTTTVTSTLLYLIVRRASGYRSAGAIASAVYLAWCPTHINFPWPVHFAIVSGCVVTLACLMHERRRSPIYMGIAGVAVFATFFYKHNFGIASLLIMTAYLLPRPPARRNIAPALAGFFVACCIYGIYLWATGSAAGFYRDMMYYTYQKIIVEHMLWTPFVYGSGTSAVVKTAFFLSPLLIAGTAWTLLTKTGKMSLQEAYLFCFPILFYGLGIRPTTDFIHLAPLLSLSGIALGILIARSKGMVRTGALLVAVAVVAGGFHSALFRGYYRWETPLAKQNIYISDPRVRIYVDEKYHTILSRMSDYFDNASSRDTLIYEYAPTLYTVLHLRNPTAYDLLPSSALSPHIEQDVTDDLDRQNVMTVITDSPLDTRTPTRITTYIRSHYRPELTLFEFSVWKRKTRKPD